jgi:hypothetical protein
MNCAQQRVDESFEVFEADGWQSNDPDAVMHCGGWSEITSAVRRYFMPIPRQALSGFLIVSFDSAIFAAHPASADVSNTQRLCID